MRESAIEKAACDYARRTGWAAYKFTSPGHRSVPDRIFFSKSGDVVMIEFKAPGKKPTPLQLREITLLQDRNLRVIWTDSLETAKAFLDANNNNNNNNNNNQQPAALA